MKLDPQKTTGALAGAYIAQIVCWTAGYFWHVSVPAEVSTALTGLLALVISHFPFPPTAG
ncbi:MAG: hypothetical protein ACYCSN_18865 [Acidobacteriaceae bacterium]